MSTETTLKIQTFALGPLETNSYVLWAVNGDGAAADCWIVDVGMWSKPMVEWLNEQNLTPSRILLTHGHGDHIGGVEYVKEAFPAAKICCPVGDVEMLRSPEKNLSATFLMGITAPEADEILEPGQALTLGDLRWQVLDTSGHTLGGVSYYCPIAGVLCSGDALFRKSVGRTDIPDGDHERLLNNIRQNLMPLPDETRVLPGHGPATTIGAERTDNPFLR
ncbi:MAG: MBL fold metallo-hydrolase [Phycisphaerae bacterium]|nr:MBL fold metallo-hydrolase [Phycisphaerae bacterium]